MLMDLLGIKLAGLRLLALNAKRSRIWLQDHNCQKQQANSLTSSSYASRTTWTNQGYLNRSDICIMKSVHSILALTYSKISKIFMLQ